MSPSTHAIVAASSAVNAPTQAMSVSTSGTSANSGVGAGHHEDAGGHHGGGVDEGGDRRRPLHRVGQPHVQRELGRLADGAQVDQEHDRRRAPRCGSVPSGAIRRASANSKVPVAAHSMHDADDEAEVAELGDPERLHGGARRRRPVVPEADSRYEQRPTSSQKMNIWRNVGRQHEAQHREGEQRLVGVVAAERGRRLVVRGTPSE